MKGRGINNLPEFLDSSPSPQPSPIKGEGVFSTFYEIINSMSKILEDIQNPQIIGFWGYITPKLGKTAVKMDFGLSPT